MGIAEGGAGCFSFSRLVLVVLRPPPWAGSRVRCRRVSCGVISLWPFGKSCFSWFPWMLLCIYCVVFFFLFSSFFYFFLFYFALIFFLLFFYFCTIFFSVLFTFVFLAFCVLFIIISFSISLFSIVFLRNIRI